MRPTSLVRAFAAAAAVTTLVAIFGALAIRFMPRIIEAMLAMINPLPEGE
jgi:hypothetical protein